MCIYIFPHTYLCSGVNPGAAVLTQSRHWRRSTLRYRYRMYAHFFFVALFPLLSISGYNLGAALNTNIYIHIHISIYTSIYIYIYTHTHTHIGIYIYKYKYKYIDISLALSLYIYIYMYI